MLGTCHRTQHPHHLTCPRCGGMQQEQLLEPLLSSQNVPAPPMSQQSGLHRLQPVQSFAVHAELLLAPQSPPSFSLEPYELSQVVSCLRKNLGAELWRSDAPMPHQNPQNFEGEEEGEEGYVCSHEQHLREAHSLHPCQAAARLGQGQRVHLMMQSGKNTTPTLYILQKKNAQRNVSCDLRCYYSLISVQHAKSHSLRRITS